MKYTVEGFSQKSLIQYGLDEKDALILRYFIDFKDSGKMKMKIINKTPYYWLKGSALLEQLPILRINNIDVLRRRLKKMTSCGILMHEHVLEGGSYAFYAIGENYENLLLYDHLDKEESSDIKSDGNMKNNYCEYTNIDDRDNVMTESLTEKSEPDTEKMEGVSEKSEESDSQVGTKDNSNNKSINNKKSDKPQADKDKSYIPYDEIIKMFNEICVSFPRVKVRNKTRDNFIRQMYRKLGIDSIKTVFEIAEASDYLSGRNGKWLNCSFDWLIKENNYIKVLEGNYSRNFQNKTGFNGKMINLHETDKNDCLKDEKVINQDNGDSHSEIVINRDLLEEL